MLFEKTKNTIEGLLFIKGEEGLTIEYLSIFLDINKKDAENVLNIFKTDYNSKEDTALIIKKFGNIYKMMVKEDIYTKIKDGIESKKMTKLSKSALETLAIIAYNQPISKLEIEKIRGVNSDFIVNTLVDKELICSNKVLDKIGKPKLYETTDLFLDIFGLESINELPNIENNNIDNNLNKFLED